MIRIMGVLLSLAFCVGAAPAQELPPIKRVPLPDAKVADLLKTDGALVEVPHANLEERLDKIEDLLRAKKTPPRLVKAVYRAELNGRHLTGGGGQWFIDMPGKGPAIFDLAAFNLAVSRMRVDGNDALLGDLDGKNLGLLLDKPGRQNVDFEWSLRGAPNVQGIAFDLRLPACPLTLLELKLQSQQTLVIPKGTGLLTGPHDSEDPDWKLWRLQVAGRTRVEFTARRGVEPGQASVVFAARDTRVELSPEITWIDTEFDIEALHRPIRDLVFEMDGDLEVHEVTARQSVVRTWKIEPLPKKGNSARNRLRVELREPLLGSLAGLRIRAAGPRWPDKEAFVPGVEMVDAIQRRETLKLHLHPDQHLERWEAGAFRLTHSATEEEGGQTLSLVDTHPQGKGKRPKFLVRSQGVDFAVSQETHWHVSAAGQRLQSEVSFDLSRGQLFNAQIRLPKTGRWQVAEVDVQPRESLQKWIVVGNILQVDLQRGLTPRGDLKLRVLLKKDPEPYSPNPRIFDIPDLEPLGAIARQGSLALFADAADLIALTANSLPAVKPDDSIARDPRLRYFFAFRQTPITGQIRVTPRKSVLHAKTRQEITLTPDSAEVKVKLAIDPVVGQPSHVDILISGTRSEPWKIEVAGADLRAKERILAREIAHHFLEFGALDPLTRWMNREVAAPRQVWRLHFREPLAKPIIVTMEQQLTMRTRLLSSRMPAPILSLDHGLALAAAAAVRRLEQVWSLPVVMPLDADRLDGEVTVRPVGVVLGKATTRHLEATSAVAGSFVRVYRFKDSGSTAAPTLRVRAEPRGGETAAQAVLDHAELTTIVDETGNVTHHLRVLVSQWSGTEFPITLPSESRILGASLNHSPLDRLARKAIEGGIIVSAPLAEGPATQLLELVYTRPASSRWAGIGLDIHSPDPKLPIAPLRFRRSTRLASGWLPLWQERLSSANRKEPARDALTRIWRLGDKLIDEVAGEPAPAWRETQRRSLRGAEANARKNLSREATFGEAMSRLLFDESKEALPIVIDRSAARALGVSPRSVLPPLEGGVAFWESLGFVHVATPRGALLTGKRDVSIDDAIANGVGEAIDHGQDATGRFCSVDYWLQTEPSPDLATMAHLLESRPWGMTEWTPLAGIASGEPTVIVRRSRVRLAAVLLGGILLALGALLRRVLSPMFFFRVVLLVSIACMLLVLPTPLTLRELLLGPLFAFAFLIARAYRGVLKSTRPKRAVSASTHGSRAAIVAGVFLVGALCRGQEPEDKTIYLLDAAAGKPRIALVRPDLLRWLAGIEKQARPTTDAVFLAARHQGRFDGEVGVFQSEFDLHLFADEGSLRIPLNGVDLREGTLLDGTPAYPVVAEGGYSVPVVGKGPHRLTLSFVVRPKTPGDLWFEGPPTPITRLVWTMSDKIGQPQLMRGQGELKRRHDFKTGENTLETSLGRDARIHLHWTPTTDGLAPASALRVRELYHWDLRAANRSVTALLAYAAAVETNQVELQLPPTLEPRSVELLEGEGSLRAWYIRGTGGNRSLVVEFPRPISGAFQLLIGFVPHGPKLDPRLPLPRGAISVEGSIGIRVDELEGTERAQFLGITAMPPETFVKEWQQQGRREIGLPLRAYRFVRATKNAAAASLEIASVPGPIQVASTVEWTAQPQVIDLAAKLTARAPAELFFVPIQLSANIILRDVRGDDLHHWSRFGNTLQVWLKANRAKPKETTLTILGWTGYGPKRDRLVALTAPFIPKATIDKGTLILGSTTGTMLDPTKVAGLGEESKEAGKRRFSITTGSGSGEFEIKPTAVAAEFQSLTVAEIQNGMATITTRFHGRLDHGDYPELHVRLSRWPTGSPKLTVSAATKEIKQIVRGEDRFWIITLPPKSPQQISFSITDQLPMPDGRELRLPEASIEKGGTLTDSWVAALGAQPKAKWSAIRQPVKELAAWPNEAARLRGAGALFAKAEATPMIVTPNETPPVPPAMILAARHRVFLADESRWMHQMSWHVAAKAGHDLEVRLPKDARFVAAFVDGRVAAPKQTGPASLTIALPATALPTQVVVNWVYPTEAEAIGRPSLASASIVGVAPGQVLGAVYAPDGWRPAADALPALEASFHRLQSLASMVEHVGEDLAASGKAGQATLLELQRSFAAASRRFSHQTRVADADVRWQSEFARLQDDHQQKMKRLGLDAQRLVAEKTPWLANPFHPGEAIDLGRPIYWSAMDDAGPPALPLRHVPSVEARRLLRGILLGAAVVCSLFVLTLWSPILRWWVRFWPEQLALLAIVGIWIVGFSLLGCGLALTGGVARVWKMILWVRKAIQD